MSPLLALTVTPPLILFVAAVACIIIGNLWMLAAAAQRGVLWFLAVLFLGFPALILVFIEPRARAPFMLMIVGVACIVGTALTLDHEKTKGWSVRKKLDYLFSEHDAKAEPVAEPVVPTLAARQERLRAWQRELERKKAALKPTDPAGQAAFNQELNTYLVELQKVKDEMAKAGR